MLAANSPPKFPIPFANAAAAPYIRTIPVTSQINITPGAASLTDGFVPLNATQIAAGGVPPFEQDFNGILKQITQSSQWQQAGGTFLFDSVFAAAVGGYPSGAILRSTIVGKYWFNLVDSNSGDPDAGAANWLAFDPSGTASTGAVQWRPVIETLPGWMLANGLTLGNAASLATGLASASGAALFDWHWRNFPNSQCPVSGGRGVNGLSDFAANKTIQVLNLCGTSMMGMDTMGGAATTFFNGVPAVFGNGTTPGSVMGENLHSLVSNENGLHGHGTIDPMHDHAVFEGTNANINSGSGAVATYVVFGTAQRSGFSATGISIQNSGAGQGHNTVHRAMVGPIYLKL